MSRQQPAVTTVNAKTRLALASNRGDALLNEMRLGAQILFALVG